MAVNRRLIFWLIKAYIKKWRKTISLFFVVGLVCFFVFRFFILSILAKFPVIQKETIGVVGAYTINTLPSFILQDASAGLTSIDASGKASPDIASSWDIKDNGTTYIFHVRKNVHFADGKLLTAHDIHLSFAQVKTQISDTFTISFHLKEPYAPFLVTVSHPIFKDGFVGVGKYRVKEVKLNGDFVASIIMSGVDNPLVVKIYSFYPTQESLRLAFVLGNVSTALGLTDITFKNITLDSFPNAKILRETNYHQLVTLFYNTQDKNLSDKKLRDALSYALPNSFAQGERASGPFPPASWAYASQLRQQDTEHAKILLTSGESPTFTISTLPKYKSVAETIANNWKQIGIQTHIKIVQGIPDTFEIFLGDFNVPFDPDQYTLWHSGQDNNITKLDDKRIDKLLEDGRKATDQGTRVKLYADFQKYLQDQQPASFLFFPFTYTITRK